MYCSTCGTQMAPGLSFCNRCGASLKEKSESRNTSNIAAYLTAVTVLGGIGIVMMFVALKKGAQLDQALVGIFMLFTFLMVSTIEVMLLRQLSKLVGSRDEQRALSPPQQPVHELRPANVASFAEPMTSVTDNTTRTLEYARREQ
jgi:hypothetical protein